jgi:hypothetical protein
MAFLFDPNKRIPEIVVYEHKDFGGHNFRTNLPKITNLKGDTYTIDINYVIPQSNQPPVIATSEWDMTKKISAIIVVSGIWQFYSDELCKKPFKVGSNPIRLGPGYYPWVEKIELKTGRVTLNISIPNDKILSFECIEPTLF